jgi:hypothetical protein
MAWFARRPLASRSAWVTPLPPGRATTLRARRSPRRGLLAALLAVLLGVGLGLRMPVAHAALASAARAAVAPSSGCTIHRIGTGDVVSLPDGWGYYVAYLWARYTAQNLPCDDVWAETFLHENPGAPHGTLVVEIIDCSSGASTEFGTGVLGGGAPGGPGNNYYINSFNYTYETVAAFGWLDPNGGSPYPDSVAHCVNV